jgi:hypothetical protein
MPPAASQPTLESTAASQQTVSPTVLNPLAYDYFEQVLPIAPVVCGLQLKCLSIGRYRLMARFKVAFVCDGEAQASVRDLMIGVLICSMECEKFKQLSSQKDFSKQVERWGRKFGFLPPRYFSWPFIGKWLAKRVSDAVVQSDAQYLMEQMDVFQKYISDASKSPPYFDESRGGRVSGAHWSQSIEAVLREFQGWTKEEVDEEPLSKGLADFFKHMENHGMVRLITSEEMERSKNQMTPEKEAELIAFAKAMEPMKGGANA